ncbi:hypothetical protein KK083_19380 [Fulvivirgaceae bacterium PWU4]|uniref:Uncharacterized protein n=1 Tax=Chryseosolibacter histidini TaxID=2782349 RepID=A0AAP2GK84_9BACT|nr:contractile injection system tape measure protein [Chryseosolibacter histidini]MBT1699066.1 hypothetical protein [Chryseosolibacter histidini]
MEKKRNHIIQKIVLELHTTSGENIDSLDAALREMVHETVTHYLERYCDAIDKPGAVLHIDKLELDLGRISTESLKHDIAKKLEIRLWKNGKPQEISTPLVTPDAGGTDLDMLIDFLDTSLISWRAARNGHKHDPSAMVNDLLELTPLALGDMLRTRLKDDTCLQRLVYHIADDVLTRVFDKLLVPLSWRAVVTDLKVMWDRCIVPGKKLSRADFWYIIGRLIHAHGSISVRQLLNVFLAHWAATAQIDVLKLKVCLREYFRIEGYDTLRNDELRQTVFRLTQEEDPDRQLLDAQFVLGFKQLAALGGDEPLKQVIGLHLKLIRMMWRFAEPSRQWLRQKAARHLKIFFSHLEIDSLPERLREQIIDVQLRTSQLSGMRETLFLQAKATMREIQMLELDPALQHKLRGLIEKYPVASLGQANAFLVKLDFMLKEQAGAEVLQLQQLADQLRRTLDEQYEHTESMEALQADLFSLLSSLEAISPAWTQQASAKDTAEICRHLNDYLTEISFPALRTGDHGAYHQLLALLRECANDPQPKTVDVINRKLDALAGRARADQRPGSSAQRRESEIYISNAGLVLIAPFLPSLLERSGYTGDRAFVDRAVAEKAVLLFQDIVHPAAEAYAEFELPLNKILCGLNVTHPVNLQDHPDQDARAEADDLVSAVLEQTTAFRNISPEGFRNAFLRREGVLTDHGNHLLLKVSRETFDIVLEKVPWQYHVVRFPWMTLPLVVEW